MKIKFRTQQPVVSGCFNVFDLRVYARAGLEVVVFLWGYDTDYMPCDTDVCVWLL